MGAELLNKMRNDVIYTIKGCFRSVCNHPFLVCLLFVLIFMYKSCPFTFSLLVSASPILVCTAVLLGTLLFFGQTSTPKTRIKDNNFVSQKTKLSKDDIVEKNETRDELEQPSVGLSLSAENKCHEICSEVNDKETESGKREVVETNRKADEEMKSEWNDGEVIDNPYASGRKVTDHESEYENSEAKSFDSEMVNVDSFAWSSWKQVEQLGDEEDDDGSDSGSDQAESSSPDASMADMIPMLDELHPLLDEDAPQPIQMSRAGSEQSPRSSTCSTESVEGTDNPDAEEEEDADDAQGDKGFGAKSAITWTEEDQKNLMQVGSSEIERNKRLEKLILRRKRRKNMSMVPEINLIDLESFDFPPHHIPSISTSRKNPFDMPHDAYGNLQLPPIPGSAPSILLPRRNPFDIPYDSPEERQYIMGDGSQELQSRDPFFRRRENFNVGPSGFAPSREDVKLRPYFVPERETFEEPSYSTLQRQASEMSDSKTSSVPYTESVSSVEDQKLEEEEEVTEEEQDHVSKMEFYEEDAPHEPEMKHISEDVGHGSQSSEGEDCLELGSIEHSESEISDLKFQSHSKAVEQRHSRGSSISSLSEVSEVAFTKIDDESSSLLDETSPNVPVEPVTDDVPHKEPVYDSSPKRMNDDIISDLSGVDWRSDEQSHGDKNLDDLEKRERMVPIGAPQEVEHSVDNGETAMSPTSDADFQEACEKITTPVAGSSAASHFYVRAMHEKDFELLEEVQVPNTPVEPSQKVRGIQSIHIPELQALDRDVSPNSKSISKPEEAVSHVDTQTINAYTDQIKDIHEGLVSELDNVWDFSKHREAERLSLPHVSETSAVESNPVEANKIYRA